MNCIDYTLWIKEKWQWGCLLFVCTGSIGNLSLNSGSAEHEQCFRWMRCLFEAKKKNNKVFNGAKKGASVFAGKHEMTCRISFYIAKQNDVLSYRN